MKENMFLRLAQEKQHLQYLPLIFLLYIRNLCLLLFLINAYVNSVSWSVYEIIKVSSLGFPNNHQSTWWIPEKKTIYSAKNIDPNYFFTVYTAVLFYIFCSAYM